MANEGLRKQLALQDSEEYRSVDVRLAEDGSLDVSAQDMGPIVQQSWGDADYEFGIRIAATDVPRLAFALIAEHYQGDLQAVNKLCDLAERHGIDPHWWSFA